MSENKNDLSRVQEFARNAHESLFDITAEGVKRPRIVHIQEVADLVWISGGSDEEVIAAWLHDVVEDTPVTIQDIEKEFGKEVAEIVHGLTDPEHFKNLPLQERKRKQAERIRSENKSIRRVKMADQISNIRFISIDPPSDMTFEEYPTYIKGAKLITDECRGISPLLDNLFDEFYKKGMA